MVKLTIIKNECKQIVREPIVMMLFLSPLLIAVVFRVLMDFLLPVIFQYFNHSFLPYKPYGLAFALIFCPMMLGVVMGFLMMEDKDAKVIELMSITPLAKRGYIQNRMAFTCLATFIHAVFSYLIIGQYILPFSSFLGLTAILCLMALVVGFVFFSLADDKVKALTYAKGLNLIVIFAFSDLLKGDFIKIAAWFFPTYWVAKIIQTPDHFLYFLYATLSALVWLVAIMLAGRWKWND